MFHLACSIRYAGEYFDKETGLYYLRARYYDPYIGRFITEDTYRGKDTNPLSLNLYTYSNNDPINFFDPTGHKAMMVGEGGGKATTNTGLKNCSTGNDVKALQEKLNSLGYNTGKADGILGSKTEAAIKEYQKDHGLTVDGKVGNQTMTSLNTAAALKNAPISQQEKNKAQQAADSTPVGAIKSTPASSSSSSGNKGTGSSSSPSTSSTTKSSGSSGSSGGSGSTAKSGGSSGSGGNKGSNGSNGKTASPSQETQKGPEIVNYCKTNNLKLVSIGATRPVCPECVNAISTTSAKIATPLK